IKIIKTKNEKETIKAGASFAAKLKGGEIIALDGDLGAGKTAWVRGMRAGLKIKTDVKSPTFVLMVCHEVSFKKAKFKTLCHVDAYRLKGARALREIGLEDYLGDKSAVTVIEWAERAKELLENRNTIEVRINFGEKEDERIISISS